MSDISDTVLVVERVKQAILTHGSVRLITSSGNIDRVKSVANWGTGFYYSKRANAKSFSQSTHISNIIGFTGLF